MLTNPFDLNSNPPFRTELEASALLPDYGFLNPEAEKCRRGRAKNLYPVRHSELGGLLALGMRPNVFSTRKSARNSLRAMSHSQTLSIGGTSSRLA